MRQKTNPDLVRAIALYLMASDPNRKKSHLVMTCSDKFEVSESIVWQIWSDIQHRRKSESKVK